MYKRRNKHKLVQQQPICGYLFLKLFFFCLLFSEFLHVLLFKQIKPWMLTGRNITQLIRLSAWNVVYSGRYTVALQRLACKRNRPFYYLHQYDGLVNRRACRGILENMQGLNFSGWGFYLLRSGIKQGYHNKKPSLLRDSRPNPVLVNPQCTDWLLTRVFQALYLLVDKFCFIRVCETIVTPLTVRFLTLVSSQTKPAPRKNFPSGAWKG